MIPRSSTAQSRRHPFVGFAAFGLFWGVWGASIPRVRANADISDGQLGIALLFIGAGALPAMLMAGRALDRFGLWLTGPLLLALGLAGAAVIVVAPGGFVALCAALAVVGATSGAADVGLNALAGRAEQATGRAVITPAHGVFSLAVVVGTLATGGLGALGVSFAVPFVCAAVGAAGACLLIARAGPRTLNLNTPNSGHSETLGRERLPLILLVGVGVLGALAFASENAHQSWSAVFLEDELAVPVGVSALGPAIFAGVVAVTRFSVSRMPVRHASSLVIAGATVTTAGTVGLSLAPTLPLALVALAFAAIGAAVLFPTLLGFVSRAVSERHRGRATSIVTAVAYTGFVAGPPFVGILSGMFGLRAGMLGLAVLTALLALSTPLVLRRGKARSLLRHDPGA